MPAAHIALQRRRVTFRTRHIVSDSICALR
jgi:hypothetical protein